MDSDDPLLFIGKHILNHVNTDAGTKEANKTLEVWEMCHIYVRIAHWVMSEQFQIGEAHTW